MANIFKTFAVNEELAEGGVWVTFRDEMRFKIRSSKSKAWQKEFEKQQKRLRHGNNLAKEDREKLLAESIAKGLMADWENVDGDNGALAFSIKNAIKVAAIPEVQGFIVNIADSLELFQDEDEGLEDIEDDEKNS